MRINRTSVANRAQFAERKRTIYSKFEALIGRDVPDMAMRDFNAA